MLNPFVDPFYQEVFEELSGDIEKGLEEHYQSVTLDCGSKLFDTSAPKYSR